MSESRPHTPPSAHSTTCCPGCRAPKPLHVPAPPSALQLPLESAGWAEKSTLRDHVLLHMIRTWHVPSTVQSARSPLPPPHSVPCSKNAATVDCA
eukprot:3853940-Rhodomonas_salina.1